MEEIVILPKGGGGGLEEVVGMRKCRYVRRQQKQTYGLTGSTILAAILAPFMSQKRQEENMKEEDEWKAENSPAVYLATLSRT